MSIRSIDYLLPGIIVMGAMVTGIMRTATGFVQEREQGSLPPSGPDAVKENNTDRQSIIAALCGNYRANTTVDSDRRDGF